jgi:hypothetical protein
MTSKRETPRDFTGKPIEIGDRVKIQGASDHQVPVYLILEHGVVTGFGRTRVILALDQYPRPGRRPWGRSARASAPAGASLQAGTQRKSKPLYDTTICMNGQRVRGSPAGAGAPPVVVAAGKHGDRRTRRVRTRSASRRRAIQED